MIVVIADDFTGAAEIGGIGIRHGLRTAIQMRTEALLSADLLVIVANTRALSETEACQKIKEISDELREFEPKFIFKKIDSALRGHVLPEIQTQMDAFGLKQAVVIAGNPSLGRVIRDGQYFVKDIPLGETGFASDPHYPMKSSSILEILDPGKKFGLQNLKSDQELPTSGIVAGDVTSEEDLKKWAENPSDSTLYAGASGYFDALLSSMDIKVVPGKKAFPFGNRNLYVEGTTFPKPDGFKESLEAQGVYFSNMPEEIYLNKDHSPQLIDQWVDEIVEKFEEQNVYITARHSGSTEEGLSERICNVLGEVVVKTTWKCELHELLIEGGDTAAVILDLLKIQRLKPVQEFETGVIRMEVMGNRNFYLTTKPGSYSWVEDVFISRQPALHS